MIVEKIFLVTMLHETLKKRYYAHKRLCKAICGHKSCEKQKTPSVDIFDKKMDLNPYPSNPPTFLNDRPHGKIK